MVVDKEFNNGEIIISGDEDSDKIHVPIKIKCSNSRIVFTCSSVENLIIEGNKNTISLISTNELEVSGQYNTIDVNYVKFIKTRKTSRNNTIIVKGDCTPNLFLLEPTTVKAEINGLNNTIISAPPIQIKTGWVENNMLRPIISHYNR